MWNEMRARRGTIGIGLAAGVAAGVLLLVLQGDEVGALLPPEATAIAGVVGYLWIRSRAPKGAIDDAGHLSEALRDDLFAWIFGSLTGALTLHTLVQGGWIPVGG